MPGRVFTPLIEGVEYTEQLAQAMILTGLTRSRGSKAVLRASYMLSIMRTASMHHRTLEFNTYHKDQVILRKRR